MYVTLRDRPAGGKPAGRRVKQRVATTVVLLGIVSMFTDVSSESVSAILPIYLTSVLGLSALAYGFVDGLYQGVSAVVRLLGGWIADRFDRPKWVATAGYALSAVSRIFLIPAQTLGAVTGVITVDRLGKGLRTAPRDALIAASSPSDALGRAFGVHRALDTFGALVGPLLAFAILYLVPGDFRSVFVASLAMALVGLAVLFFLVPDLRPGRRERPGATADPPSPGRVSLRLLRTPQLGRLLIAAGILGLVTIGDGFLYLALSARDSLATTYFPLLYVGTNFAYLALAVPFGRLADRIGRTKVYIGGYVALLVSYLCAGGLLSGPAALVACLLLLGAYYAATDGVLAALAARVSATSVRTSGIATAQTILAAARFASSLLFGLMWTQVGRVNALWIMTAALVVGIPAAALLLRGVDRPETSSVEA